MRSMLPTNVYSPVATCGLAGGMLAHALFGTGLAGEVRPPDPWDDIEGLEGGVRIEWRAGRFSFSLSDYYGYDDLPYLDHLNVFERNVDPRTVLPRRAGSRTSERMTSTWPMPSRMSSR